MRPEKKKVRHHDSRKREAAAKKKNNPNKPPQPKGEEEERTQEQEGAEADDSGFSKRAVVSNWTKYELPSSGDERGLDSDGEEDPSTGEDYAHVLANAGNAGERGGGREGRSRERRVSFLLYPTSHGNERRYSRVAPILRVTQGLPALSVS